MTLLQIEEGKHHQGLGLWRLGFRPFFLGAGVLAVLFMALWMVIFPLGGDVTPTGYAAPVWHAHEMIFGYAVAVIAGFLLTAVKNWTNVQTVHGPALMGVFLLWVAARLAPFTGLPEVAFLFDMLFLLFLSAGILHPVIKARSWNQLGIVAIVLALAGSNLVFYLGLLGVISGGGWQGLHAGLYLIIALILVVGRRVIPFFIERGCDTPVQLTYRAWLDVAILACYLLFAIVEIFVSSVNLSALLAGTLVILNLVRLWDWHTPGIWRKPLLWVLYVAYLWITFGFLLKVGTLLGGLSPSLAVHAFTVGGIGMMTLGMMARVSLGHTGRNVFAPPRVVNGMFLLLGAAAVVRVLLPLLDFGHYTQWVLLSQWLWMAAFALFVLVYAPILVKPRIDGRYG